MFYEQQTIVNLLKCQHCSLSYDVYDQPRILPCCGKTVCNRCIYKVEKEIKNNFYKCVLCEEENYVPKKGFPINEVAAKLVFEQPKEVYRGEKCEEFKLNLGNLETLTSRLTFDLDHGEDVIKEHCFELRRLIQLATEKKIQEIISNSEILIQKVDDYETETIERFANNDEFKEKLSHLIKESNMFLYEQKNYLNQYKINDKEISSLNDKLTKLKLKLEDNMCLKRIIFNNALMKFDTNKTHLDESLIGNISYKRIDSNLSKLISASADETIKLWDFNTGECLRTFEGHTNWVRCVKLMSNEKLISCSDDNTIKIWNMKTGECLQTFLGHSKQIYSIQVMPNDKIVSCSLDRTIKIWDLKSGIQLKSLEGHTDSVYSIELLSNNLIVSSSGDKKIKVWNMATGDCVMTMIGHTHSVYCIDVISEDLIVSGSEDMTIRIWDVNSGDCVKILLGHTKYVWCIKALPYDQVISGSGDETIKLWNINTGEPLRTFKCHSGIILDLQIISKERIISSSSDKTIKIWDLLTGNCLQTLEGHSQRVISIQAF